jgi:Glycosyltransferases involved in cell wall biogenesis
MASTLHAEYPSESLLEHHRPNAVGRVLVVIPTYCEAGNIEAVLTQTRRALPSADILVVDDNSPDGTALLVSRIGAQLGGISVLSRPAKNGLGAAYRAGFAHGIELGYDVLVEMDADLSHDPAALPALIKALERGADLAIGSRYVPGASIPGWTTGRRALSRYGNRYAAFMLGLDAMDLTSGYRAFRADALLDADYASTASTGYAFQIELASRVTQARCAVREVPITFNDRNAGDSKMSMRITAEALLLVTWWGVRSRVRRLGARIAAHIG